MKKKRTIFRLAMFALGLALAGCLVGNNGSLVILGAAPGSLEGTQCLAPSPNTDQFRSGGVLDLNVATGYTVFLILRNNMPNNTNTPNLTLDGRTVIVERVRMSYRGDSQVPLAEYHEVATGTVESGGGQISLPVTVLRLQQIDLLRADPTITASRPTTVLVNVTVDGRLTDGGHISSSQVAFPIKVCRGCLRGVPEGQPCPQDPNQVDVCIPGQDEVMDCSAYDLVRR